MNTLRLLIPRKSYNKIMGYAKACDQEISGFADVEYKQDESAFVVGQVYLLEQEVGPAETEMTEEAVSQLMLKFINEGKTQMPRLWWHSHVHMATFFSGTDDATMAMLKNDSFVIGLVVNKEKSMLAQLRVYCAGITLDDMPVAILEEEEADDPTLVQEVNSKVKKREYNWWGGDWRKHEKSKKKFKGRNILPRIREAAKTIVSDYIGVWYDQTLKSFIYELPGGQQWVDRWGTLDDEPVNSGVKYRYGRGFDD